MAATSQTTSRLQLLQARFQQRQLQEKEQKLLQMYDQQQQRALQVAKRGSASSSSSNGSVHKISSTSVRVHRQTFDDKRQSSTSSSSTSSTGSVKGIDKSYPLEPLKSKLSNSNGRTVIHQNSSSSIITNGGTSSVKRGTNGVQSTASFRRNGTGIGNLRNQDVRASARAAATTTPQVIHGIYTEVREQHNALARKASKAAYDRDETDRVDRRDSGSFGERHNGHAAEYEINIDEVIDNDAMQRNRMVARVSNGQHHHARRRPSATMDENQQILANPRDEHSTAAGKTSLSRKSSTAASELSTRNAKNAATSKRSNLVRKPSTYMKTTKSASLKVKPALLRGGRSTKDLRRKSKSPEYVISSSGRKYHRSLSLGSEALKSTSLICEVIRRQSMQKQSESSDTKTTDGTSGAKLGRVKSILTKLESIAAEAKALMSSKRTKKIQTDATEDNYNPDEPLPSTTPKRHSLIIEDATTRLPVFPNSRRSSTELAVEVERSLRRLSSDAARRASFETKLRMFEQILNQKDSNLPLSTYRRDSVESALRHFDSIEAHAVTQTKPTSSYCQTEETQQVQTQGTEGEASCSTCARHDNHKHEGLKGFERHTSAWCHRTRASTSPEVSKQRVDEEAKAAAKKRKKKKKLSRKQQACPMLEARDSIELSKIPQVKSRLPACSRRKIVAELQRKRSDERRAEALTRSKEKQSEQRRQSEDKTEVSTRDAMRKVATKRRNERLSERFSPSTGSSNGDLSRGGAASGEFKENGGPGNKRIASYASTKNSSNGNEQKDPSASTKSGSLKFLSKIVGSNGDVSFTTNHHTENTAPLPRRKLSSQAAPPDSPTSHEPASRKKSIDDHQHQQFQQQRQSSPAATPAPRFGATGNNSSTSSQQSSGSTLASSASRSHGSIGSRIGAGSRGSRGGAAPTPASRTSIVHEGSKQNDDSLSTCKICNRRFNIDRIGLHEQICSKTAQKKRKQFDASTHRVKGTELESFVQKPGSKSKLQSKSVQKPEQPKPPTSNWRRKHEDFISAIRSAKQMTAHIAAGGKLSDLPPPPPSDTSDYVQCPHCSRKFNQGAAERHIPKCESMQHNKPKAQPRTIKR